MKINWFRDNLGTWSNIRMPDGHIDCGKFIDAARKFVGLYPDHEGLMRTQTGWAFNKALERFQSNVVLMSDYYEENRMPDGSHFPTLNAMILHEMRAGKSDIYGQTASKGLLWFAYTHQFLCEGFGRNLEDGCEESFPDSIRAGYYMTLNKHHNPLVKPIFLVAMRFCPEKETFYRSMMKEGSLEETYTDAKMYFREMARAKDMLVQYCSFNKWRIPFGDESNDLTEEIKVARTRKRPHDETLPTMTKHSSPVNRKTALLDT